MRENETMGIFRNFDRLFGFKNVLTRSHEVFEKCSFYLADGTFTPEWDEEGEMKDAPETWKHHLWKGCGRRNGLYSQSLC